MTWDEPDHEYLEQWRMFWCQACKRYSPFSVVIEAPPFEQFMTGDILLELCRSCFDDEGTDWLETESRLKE